MHMQAEATGGIVAEESAKGIGVKTVLTCVLPRHAMQPPLTRGTPPHRTQPLPHLARRQRRLPLLGLGRRLSLGDALAQVGDGVVEVPASRWGQPARGVVELSELGKACESPLKVAGCRAMRRRVTLPSWHVCRRARPRGFVGCTASAAAGRQRCTPTRPAHSAHSAACCST